MNVVRAVMTIVCVFGFVGPSAAFAAGPAAVNLGTAGNYAVLAKTGISTTGSTAIVGNIGLSPAAATYITGFGLILPPASAFSTSALVSGNIYAPGYADPTSANLTAAVLDMQNAYTDGAGRAPTVTELGAGTIGGLTLTPGVYKWSTNVTIPTNITLSGGADDVWIFVIAQNLTVSSGVNVVLSGGAQAGNVFWIVAGQTTIGTTAVFNGNIVDQTAIVLNTGATLNGRALAQSAVNLDSNSVNIPSDQSVVALPASAVQTSVVQPPVSVVSVANTSGYVAIPSTPPVSSPISSPVPSPVFENGIKTVDVDLAQGSRDSDVSILQQFLISQNKGLSAQALANVGATSYFGALTRAALAEFQSYVGISPPLGNFGPITRNYISTHY